jgi:hypothetical protein
VSESGEFKAIQEDTTHLITNFTKALKLRIVKVARLELATANCEAQVDLCKNLHACCRAILINLRDNTCPHKLVAKFMDIHHRQLLKNIKLNYREFKEVYQLSHTIDHFPSIIEDDYQVLEVETVAATATTAAAANALPPQPPDQPIASPQFAELFDVLLNTFGKSFSVYKAAVDSSEIAIQLKQLKTEFFGSDMTRKAVVTIDDEPTVPAPTMLQLVQKSTKEQTAQLQRELQGLKDRLAALAQRKNAPRGPRSASKEKEKSDTTTEDS